MTKVHRGDYIVFDYKDYRGNKNIGVTKTGEKNGYASASHMVSGTIGDIAGMLQGKGKNYTEREPDVFHINSPYGLQLPMNMWRIPPLEAQQFFQKCDQKIHDLEAQIQQLRINKTEYAKEHRLEWDMPTFQDFEEFIPRSEQ